MKIVIVARRNEQRIVRWQGVLAIVLVYLVIGVPIFFGGIFWLSHTVPSIAGIMTFLVFSLLCFLGSILGCAMKMPLHELPLLNRESARDGSDRTA